MDFLPVDRNDPRILAGLQKSTIIYKKNVEITARPGVSGEEVITKLRDCIQEETRNTVTSLNDWVVTNPAGESYIVPGTEFFTKYEGTNVLGVYVPKGYIKATKNPFGNKVVIDASWGAKQYGEADCLFACGCSEKGELYGEPYIIAKEAFIETYIKVIKICSLH
jgi:hypothetical protein